MGKGWQGSLENGEITQFYFHNLQRIELCLNLIVLINLLTTFLAVLVCSLQTEVNFRDEEEGYGIFRIGLNLNVAFLAIECKSSLIVSFNAVFSCRYFSDSRERAQKALQ